jgi:hypothetical protein
LTSTNVSRTASAIGTRTARARWSRRTTGERARGKVACFSMLKRWYFTVVSRTAFGGGDAHVQSTRTCSEENRYPSSSRATLLHKIRDPSGIPALGATTEGRGPARQADLGENHGHEHSINRRRRAAAPRWRRILLQTSPRLRRWSRRRTRSPTRQPFWGPECSWTFTNGWVGTRRPTRADVPAVRLRPRGAGIRGHAFILMTLIMPSASMDGRFTWAQSSIPFSRKRGHQLLRHDEFGPALQEQEDPHDY